jgi:SET domain-containing protein
MITQLKRPLKLEIRSVPGKGWGVFATSPIFEGEIIEECPLLPIPKTVYQHIPDFLADYVFSGSEVDLENHPVIPLGLGCIYNHSNKPNARWQLHREDNKVFQFVSIKEIKAGEEICTYYGGEDYWAQRPYINLI